MEKNDIAVIQGIYIFPMRKSHKKYIIVLHHMETKQKKINHAMVNHLTINLRLVARHAFWNGKQIRVL